MKKEVGRWNGLGKNGSMGLTWEQARWRLASGLWCQSRGGVQWGGGLSARETDLGWPKEEGFFMASADGPLYPTQGQAQSRCLINDEQMSDT